MAFSNIQNFLLLQNNRNVTEINMYHKLVLLPK